MHKFLNRDSHHKTTIEIYIYEMIKNKSLP